MNTREYLKVTAGTLESLVKEANAQTKWRAEKLTNRMAEISKNFTRHEVLIMLHSGIVAITVDMVREEDARDAVNEIKGEVLN